jgi:hypothetical protein
MPDPSCSCVAPAEIDAVNAEHVGEQLRAAFAPGVTAVSAEVGLTVFAAPLAAVSWWRLIKGR